MEWLLILTMVSASGVSVEQIGFESQEHCVKAIEVIRETQPGLELTASCVKTRGQLPSLTEMFTSKKLR